MGAVVFVRLQPGKYVRADQVAAIVEDGRGWATLTLTSGVEIQAPELTARKVLNILIREVTKAALREDAVRCTCPPLGPVSTDCPACASSEDGAE